MVRRGFRRVYAGSAARVARVPGPAYIVFLGSASTPQEYVDCLRERVYQMFWVGEQHVDLTRALVWIRRTFAIDRLLVDSGPTLTRALLDAGLVDEVSVLVHPVVVGAGGRQMFAGVRFSRELELAPQRTLESDVAHLRCRLVG